MIFIKALFIVVEVVCCLLLIGIILLQKSKSEGLGLAFGAGAGESLFGARAGNVLSKATVVLGVVFLASTLFLGILFAQKDKGIMDDVAAPAVQPASMQMQPIDPNNLVLPTDVEVPAVITPEEAAEVAVKVEEEEM
jgi:preprotein translocase subunit SecG